MRCNFDMLQSFSATCFGQQQTNHPAQVGLYLSSYFRRPRRYLVCDVPLGQLISDKAGKGLRLPRQHGADTTELVHVLRGRVNRKLLGSCRSRIRARTCLWDRKALVLGGASQPDDCHADEHVLWYRASGVRTPLNDTLQFHRSLWVRGEGLLGVGFGNSCPCGVEREPLCRRWVLSSMTMTRNG